MSVCESWTIKKAECWRIDAFELWCWGRLLRVPWTVRRSNQSILKEISVEYSLEGLMLKLKLQYFGHLMQRTDSLEKTLMLGMIEGGKRRGNRGWDGWMASPTQWTWVWVSSRSWWWTGKPGVLQSMGLQSRTQLSNWTELIQSRSVVAWGWGKRLKRSVRDRLQRHTKKLLVMFIYLDCGDFCVCGENTFIASYKFWHMFFHFHLFWDTFKIPFWFPLWLNNCSRVCCLISLSVNFLIFLLLWISSFILLWSEMYFERHRTS